jgi:hypothetical protein
MVRFADDVVAVFESRDDCARVRCVMEKRLAKHGQTLHPDKTRVVDFRFLRRVSAKSDKSAAGCFDFLGFTHYWRRSRRDKWVVTRTTAKSRYARSLRNVSLFCRRNRHLPLAAQHRRIGQMMQGHYSYFGITGNSNRIRNYAHAVGRIWHKWLARRSGRKRLKWEQFNRLLTRLPLPPPRLVHVYSTPP